MADKEKPVKEKPARKKAAPKKSIVGVKTTNLDSLSADFGTNPLSTVRGKKSIRRAEDVERIKQDWENRTVIRANKAKLKASVGDIIAKHKASVIEAENVAKSKRPSIAKTQQYIDSIKPRLGKPKLLESRIRHIQPLSSKPAEDYVEYRRGKSLKWEKPTIYGERAYQEFVRKKPSEPAWTTDPDPNYQEYVRNPKKWRTENRNPDPNYQGLEDRGKVVKSTKLTGTVSKVNKTILAAKSKLSNKIPPQVSSLVSKVAKSKVAGIAGQVARSGAVRSAGIAGAVIGSGIDAYNLSVMGAELGKSVAHKPVKVIPRESAFGKPTFIKYEGGVRDKRGVMMYPMKKTDNPLSANRYNQLKSKYPLSPSVASTGMNGIVSSSSKMSKRRLPIKNTTDLSFLRLKPRTARPRPMPRKELSWGN